MNFFGEDFIVVSDSMLSRVWKLDRRGQPFAARRVRDIGSGGKGEFYYVAIDYYANVWCSDRGGGLHKFDRELRFLSSVGRPGHDDYEFDEPRGLGLYRRFGQLFVSEREGAQYLWMGTDVFTPSVADLKRIRAAAGAVRAVFPHGYSQVKLDLVDAASVPRVALQLRSGRRRCRRTPVRFEATTRPRRCVARHRHPHVLRTQNADGREVLSPFAARGALGSR